MTYLPPRTSPFSRPEDATGRVRVVSESSTPIDLFTVPRGSGMVVEACDLRALATWSARRSNAGLGLARLRRGLGSRRRGDRARQVLAHGLHRKDRRCVD